jgi:ABC-type nickel/cobalt efflux system permease component RcnA
MASFAALILAPTLVLANLGLIYALVPRVCGWGSNAALDAANGLSIVLTGLATLAALVRRRRLAVARGDRKVVATPAHTRAFFVATVGLSVGALSTLALLSFWIPVWVLSPCD